MSHSRSRILQDRPDYSSDYDLFVGGDDSNGDAALGGGDDGFAAGVAGGVEV